MQIKELITESLSPIVYHYTRLLSAIKILESGTFELSSVLGSVEQKYSPKGYFYFLSTTRTKVGGYHQGISSDAVMFVLDGTWYNQRYPAKSVDYWLNRDPAVAFHRAHEAEDRLFSKEPTIPITGVMAMHVYVSPEAEPRTRAWARKALILAKKRKIKTYLYNDKEAWRLQDIRKQTDVSMLEKGVDDIKGYVSRNRGYLLPWIELLSSKDPSKMSDKAKSLVYSLKYYGGMYKQDMINGFESDLSNARKPNSGPDRKHATTIINFMRANRLNDVGELIEFLKKKYSAKKQD